MFSLVFLEPPALLNYFIDKHFPHFCSTFLASVCYIAWQVLCTFVSNNSTPILTICYCCLFSLTAIIVHSICKVTFAMKFVPLQIIIRVERRAWNSLDYHWSMKLSR